MDDRPRDAYQQDPWDGATVAPDGGDWGAPAFEPAPHDSTVILSDLDAPGTSASQAAPWQGVPGAQGDMQPQQAAAVGQEAFAAPVAPVPAGAPTGQSAPAGQPSCAAVPQEDGQAAPYEAFQTHPVAPPHRRRATQSDPPQCLPRDGRSPRRRPPLPRGLRSPRRRRSPAGFAQPYGASPVPAQPPYGGARGSAYTRRSPVTRPRPPGPAAAAVGRAALCGRLPRADAAAQEAHGLYVGIGVTVVVLIALVAAVGAFVLPELLASDDVPASERIEGRTVTTRLRTSRGRGRR